MLRHGPAESITSGTEPRAAIGYEPCNLNPLSVPGVAPELDVGVHHPLSELADHLPQQIRARGCHRLLELSAGTSNVTYGHFALLWQIRHVRIGYLCTTYVEYLHMTGYDARCKARADPVGTFTSTKRIPRPNRITQQSAIVVAPVTISPRRSIFSDINHGHRCSEQIWSICRRARHQHYVSPGMQSRRSALSREDGFAALGHHAVAGAKAGSRVKLLRVLWPW